MAKRISLVLISFFIIIILSGCTTGEISLDEISKFRPEDKYFVANLKSLHFVIETSEIERVDNVFKTIISDNDLPFSANGCRDGVYIGESPYDAYDYKHVVKLEIKNEKIVVADYDEVKKEGKGKQNNIEYCEEMSSIGTTPAIAYPIYEKALLEEQNIFEVDAVSGATYSLYRFRYAVVMALIKASLWFLYGLVLF